MKAKTLLITVMLVMSFTKTAIAQTPIPQEIAEQLNTPGHVISHHEILSDSDLKHLI